AGGTSRRGARRRAPAARGGWQPARGQRSLRRRVPASTVAGPGGEREPSAMRRTTRFRRLMEAPEILVLPGIHDALSLRLAEEAGFQAVAAGGYSATASLLGAPDVGQLTMTEMADMYARLADQTTLPIFADADTGHGNTSNVARTVRAFERAGVAALFLEDQVAPKRCGHMDGKAVVP